MILISQLAYGYKREWIEYRSMGNRKTRHINNKICILRMIVSARMGVAYRKRSFIWIINGKGILYDKTKQFQYLYKMA